MLEWQWPWLAIAFPLPWITRWLAREYKSRPTAIRVPFYSTLIRTGEENHPAASFRAGLQIDTILMAFMWLALLTAAARPVWYGESINIATSGRDLLMLVDLSDSMRIDDMIINGQPSQRIDVVKSIANEFIARRDGDRIGLLLFGQRAYLQTPLTLDRDSVAVQLAEALPGFAGSSTAIGDALGAGINLLRDRPSASRVMIVLSDGANTFGSEPLDAMQVALDAKVKIHTIAFGATEQTTTNQAGQQVTINPSSDLDTQTLGTIATTTGGSYFRATNPQELEDIYHAIDKLEPTAKDDLVKPQRSLFHWPLGFALLTLVLLVHTRKHRTL